MANQLQARQMAQKWVKNKIKQVNIMNINAENYTVKELNDYASAGGDLKGFSKEQLKQITQESIKKYAEKGGDISVFTYEQRKAFHEQMIEEEMGLNR